MNPTILAMSIVIFSLVLAGCNKEVKSLRNQATQTSQTQENTDTLTPTQSSNPDISKGNLISGRFIFKQTDQNSLQLISKKNRITTAEDGKRILKNYLSKSQKIIKQKALTFSDDNRFFRVDISQGSMSADETKALIEKLREKGIEVEADLIATTQSSDTYAPPSKGSWGQDFDDLWGFKRVHAEDAWAITRGDSVVVAVLDTGVDANHEDLIGQVLPGYDFVDSQEDTRDFHGHGTHVAGTIAALADNGIGIAGIAPHVKILPVKVLSDAGSGSFSGIASGIRYAADQGAHIINMSLGGTVTRSNTPSYLTSAIKYAYDKGVTIVAAAGNNSANVNKTAPANDPRVIPVSATDHDGYLAGFSNHGLTIAVTAPGGGYGYPKESSQYTILSLYSSDSDRWSKYKVGEKYVRLAGTSMAAPHVAGVAALIKSHNPDYTPSQVQQALSLGAEDLGTAGPDWRFGMGMVSATGSLAVESPLSVQITGSTINAFKGEGVVVEGIISGANLKEWRVETTRNRYDWQKVLEGTSPAEGTIGQFQNSRNETGLVYLRLIAVDQSGKEYMDYYLFESSGAVLKVPPTTGFEEVSVDFPATKQIEISNVKPYVLSDLSASVSGERFSFTGGAYPGINGTCSDRLSSYQKCVLEIIYEPKTPVTNRYDRGELAVNYSFSGTQLLTEISILSGVGVETPVAILNYVQGDQLDFGTVNYTESAERVITIINSGNASATSLEYDLDLPSSGYEISSNGCGDVIEAASQCDLVVKFTNHIRNSDNVSGQVVLNVSYASGLRDNRIDMALKAARATYYSNLKIDDQDYSSIYFPVMTRGEQYSQIVEISNTGNDRVMDADEFSFSIRGVSDIVQVENVDCQSVLKSEEKCRLRILISTDSSTEGKLHYDILDLSYKNYGISLKKSFNLFVDVRKQVANLSASSQLLDFGTVSLGSSKSMSVTLENTGELNAYNITLNHGFDEGLGFETTGCIGDLGPGESCEMLVSLNVSEGYPLGLIKSSFTLNFHNGYRLDSTEIEVLVDVITPGINPWQNPNNRFDVNDDGRVTSLDALNIINRLNVVESGDLPEKNTTGVYYDVNGDGRISSLDSLQVINEVGRLNN